MATWESTITVVDLAAKRIRATATRTDGEDVRTYSCTSRIDTENVSQSKLQIAQSIWGQYQADLAHEASVATLLARWEADLNGWLAGQES